MNIKILIAVHKEYPMPQDGVYLPVHVGKALHPDTDLGYQPDNTGENISAKNPYYSELTAIYWAWKNLDADFIGLAHYRRHFRLHRRGREWKSILTGEELEPLCKAYDAVLPKKRCFYIETIYSHFDHTFDCKYLDITRKVVEELSPSYLESFDRAMRQKSAHFFNMFIMKRELLNDYCSWLFPILERLEERFDLASMDAFHARIIGRIGEILFDVWLMGNDIKYTEIGYVFLGKKNYLKKIIGFLQAKYLGKKYTQSL